MILTLDASGDGFGAAVVQGGAVLAERVQEGARGSAGLLPAMADAVLREAGGVLEAVAVVVGPGGFTGLRAALSLAHGVGLAACVPVWGVTVGDALWAPTPGRALWVVVDTRRSAVFLQRGAAVAAFAPDALPSPPGPVALAGNAAGLVSERLRALGHDVLLLPGVLPTPAGIAAAALRGPVRPAQPLYVDPPAARPS